MDVRINKTRHNPQAWLAIIWSISNFCDGSNDTVVPFDNSVECSARMHINDSAANSSR
jgi:hypothetical protein